MNFVKPINYVAILVNEYGVCDVAFGIGASRDSLSSNTENCQVGDVDVAEFKIAIVPELPMVGFHAKADDTGLIQLGLILVDKISPDCIMRHPDEDWASMN